MKGKPAKTPRTGCSRKNADVALEGVQNHRVGVRLLIVDDHAVVRGGLDAMLSAAPGIGQIATAHDGMEALKLCASFDPHVILLDVRMPGMDGHSAMQTIGEKWPHIRVIILTGNDTPADIKLARRHGAAGFLSKSEGPATLLRVIEKVSAGGTSFPEVRDSDCDLSPRELEVLRHLVRGLTNDDIGRALGVSGQTIKGHLKHIFPKLDAATRAEAVNRVHELGLV